MIFLVGSCVPHFILGINNSLLPSGVIISVTPVLYAKAASSVRNEIVCTLRRLQREEQRGRRTEITKVAFIEREGRRESCTVRRDSWSQGCGVQEGAKDVVVVVPLIVR